MINLSQFLSGDSAFSNAYLDFFEKKLPTSKDQRSVYALLRRPRDKTNPNRPGVIKSELILDVDMGGKQPRKLEFSSEAIRNLTQTFTLDDLKTKVTELRDLVDRGRVILMTREEVEAHILENAAAVGLTPDQYIAEAERYRSTGGQEGSALADYVSPNDTRSVEMPDPNKPIVDLTTMANVVRPQVMQLAQFLARTDPARMIPENRALYEIRGLTESLADPEIYYLLCALPPGRYSQVRRYLLQLSLDRAAAEDVHATDKSAAKGDKSAAKTDAKRPRKRKTDAPAA
jgi:hypothetical protein